MKKIALITHGCPKNLIDSELIVGILNNSGYQVTLDEDDADICICTDLDEVLKPGWGTELRRVAEENPTAGQIYYYYAWSSDETTGDAKRYFW